MKIGVVESAQVKDANGKIVVTGPVLRYEDAFGHAVVVPIPEDWPKGNRAMDAQILRILVNALEGSN